MKTHLVVLLALTTALPLTAQTSWKGGAPGQETDWYCASNWSNNRVPGEFDQVIIPDCSTRGNFYPVVRRGSASVKALNIHSNAHLTIASGAQLSIRGYGLPGGALLNLGAIQNNGTLEIIEPVLHAVDYSGKGMLVHRKSNLTPDDCKCETEVCM